jgi:8-oxo-dGTP diphosphatase
VSREPVHVAVGVLRREGKILLTRRLEGTHLAGCWEFPGGKFEPGETPQQALVRELHEELGIAALTARPLISHRHRYPARDVVLHAFEVTAWQGEPRGRQGQALRWLPADTIDPAQLPPADGPLLAAARLPDVYAISGGFDGNQADFLSRVERLIAGGVRLLCLRCPDLDTDTYRALATAVLALAQPAHMQVLLHGAADWVPGLASELGAGLHLPERAVAALERRPVPARAWCAASCHDAQELAQAARIGCDFAVLSPVAVTASHPDHSPLGWDRFAEWVDSAALPVYALGGMRPEFATTARAHGGQGVAVLRGLWDTASAP